MIIEATFKRFPKARYFVLLGNKSWICSLGVSREMVYELNWWQNREYSVQDFGLSRYTFVGSKNESLEAIIEFKKGREDRGVEDLDESLGGECGRAGILDIGGSLAVEVDVRDVTVPN